MNVIVIQRHVTDSWKSSPSTFLALAGNQFAALSWILDEVEGKHGSGHSYAQGHTAQWWVDQGIFSLTDVPVHGSIAED